MIENCKTHIIESKKQGSIIEQYLIQFLLISICREYESYLKKTIQNIIEKRSDDKIANYVYSLIERRPILKYSILENILSVFDIKYKQIFRDDTSNIQRTYFNNIRYNRNLVAHGDPVHITFGDVVDWHHESIKIIGAFFNTLNMKL